MAMKPNWSNRTLFHGDNLEFMRAMNSETVDLIATDPPFNKGRDFHATPDSLATGAKFQDRWSWERDVHEDWLDLITDDHPDLMAVIQNSRKTYGDDMGAFLCFMAVRLVSMRRLLKPTGSLYLHCDPTASHYLKMLLDDLQFGKTSYSWLTNTDKTRGHLGVTDHGEQDVTLYTTRISRRVDQFRHKSEQTLRHVTSQVSLDELVHTIQGRPKPYEMYAQQVQANVFAYVWYKQLHNDSTPPIRLYDLDTIDKHRDDDCNLTGEFLTQKQKYQNLEKQYADKNKTAKEKADIKADMVELARWFDGEMTHEFTLHGLLYDENADLGCTEKDKKD